MINLKISLKEQKTKSDWDALIPDGKPEKTKPEKTKSDWNTLIPDGIKDYCKDTKYNDPKGYSIFSDEVESINGIFYIYKYDNNKRGKNVGEFSDPEDLLIKYDKLIGDPKNVGRLSAFYYVFDGGELFPIHDIKKRNKPGEQRYPVIHFCRKNVSKWQATMDPDYGKLKAGEEIWISKKTDSDEREVKDEDEPYGTAGTKSGLDDDPDAPHNRDKNDEAEPYGTAGTKSGLDDDPDNPDIRDDDDDSESVFNGAVSTAPQTRVEQILRDRFYRNAVNVTGIQDKVEAVKAIQRLLVDMGYSVKNKGVVNPTDDFDTPESLSKEKEMQHIRNAISRYKMKWGSKGPLFEDRTGDLSARAKISWNEKEDEKYGIDGKPGPLTRNAVKIYQHWATLTHDLGKTGRYGDGVDGIVGEKTWNSFPEKFKNTITQTKDRETREPATKKVEPPKKPRDNIKNKSNNSEREVSPSDEEPEEEQQEEYYNVQNIKLGLSFFDKRIEIAFNKDKLQDMANKKRGIGIVTRSGKINPNYDTLLYDAYLIYKELDGVSFGDSAEVSGIIDKYTENVYDNANQEQSILNQEGLGLFGEDSKYFFKGHALYYAYNGRLHLEDDVSPGQDLIKWLVDDGLTREAKKLRGRMMAETYIAKKLMYIMDNYDSYQLDLDTMKKILLKASRIQLNAAAININKIKDGTFTGASSVRFRDEEQEF